MQTILEFYLNFSGPLVALALLSFSVFVLMLPLYWLGDLLLAREKQRKSLMKNEFIGITSLREGKRKYFYTQEIYRRYGYNPLYGLVGLFGLAVQMPFFFAAYRMLHEFGAFYGLAVGPFDDLAQPDGLLRFSGLTIHVLPLLMTFINLLAAYYYIDEPEEKAKIWLFPALFLVLLYQQPVALVFYWSMNNVFSLLKNLWKKRGQSLVLENLSGVNLRCLGRTARAWHIGLFFTALFLSVLYFIESEKALPLLWLDIALCLLLYLGLYYAYLEIQVGSSIQKKYMRDLVRLSCWVLLAGMILVLLRLLQLDWQSAALQDKSSSEQLTQLFVLEKAARELRSIAWWLGLAAVLCGQILLGRTAWLWSNDFAKKSPQYGNDFRRYVLSVASIFVAIFWTVPARVVASDPASFEGNSNYLLLVSSLVLFCLLPLGLFVLLYLVLPKILRYYGSCLASIAAWFFSANVLLFPGNYGPMEFTSFRNPLNISNNSVAASVLLMAVLLLVLLTCYLSWHYQSYSLQKWLKLDRVLPLLLGIHVLLIASSFYKIGRYHFQLAEGTEANSPSERRISDSGTKVQLSRGGRNIIILMLDKFMGGFVPEILQAEPELARRLDGFVFYPNAVSQAQRTYGGFHPIVGGSEYTVEQMNAKQRPLAADMIEAFTMIPKALNEKFPNFASYFVNVEYVLPPQAHSTMLQRLAEEKVQVLKTSRNYHLLPKPELARGKSPDGSRLKWQNFLSLLGLFQAFGPIFREKIYNHGKWMGLLGNSDIWASVAFWLPYIELLSLEELFEASNEISGSYVLYHNQLPHNSTFIDSEKYFGNQDNFRFPLPPIPQILREIDEQNNNKAQSTVYLANYATLYLVANWLDTLKEQGLYDNTEIYLVSDHGSTFYDPSFQVQGAPRSKGSWHSLYMRKNFDAHVELQTSSEFRTVADIPSEFLPQFGISQNPYSGKVLEPVRVNPVPLFVVEGVLRSEELAGNDYQYYILDQYNLYNHDIFHNDNWKVVR